ncbi:MAG: hypothetical protein E7375_01825 [Clostridiales bacterium]|nr:hypothetical protein [Clostridiales bacterium]
MNLVSSWLLSIAGVVLLSVLSEFILPEGQMNKYTKVVFSFIILLVIIMPLPKVFGKEIDLSKYFPTEENVLQEDYLYQVNINKLNSLNEDLSKEITNAGLNKVVVSINANVLSETLEIYSIYVDLCDIEYNDSFENKNKTSAKTKIKEIVNSFSLLKDVELQFDDGEN